MSNSSREESPDWVRSFQTPTKSALTLSSDSEPPSADSQLSEDEKDNDHDDLASLLNRTSSAKSADKKLKTEPIHEKKRKRENHGKSEGKRGDGKTAKQETSEKPIKKQVSSSSLPLVLSEKVQCSKALVECEGESIDLSGDVGAVGRVVISDNPFGNHDMFLDLKGTIYKTTIVPSQTFCVVSFGQSEAKIEAIMNDFIQLKPESNVYEAETMVEGTLDGFSFDSEDEADNLPKATANQNDQNEGGEEQQNGKGKGIAEKKSAPGRKKGKSAGVKAPKKVKKKTQVAKKTKAKK